MAKPVAGLICTAARCIAVDEQDDIARGHKLIGQPLLGGLMHPATAVQSDDGRKRACAIWPGQIALYALAQDNCARKELLRGAFELDGLQRRSTCISRQRMDGAPKYQRYRGLGGDCRQWRLPLQSSQNIRENCLRTDSSTC